MGWQSESDLISRRSRLVALAEPSCDSMFDRGSVTAGDISPASTARVVFLDLDLHASYARD